MWLIDTLELRSRNRDPATILTEVRAERWILTNALELIACDTDRVQLVMCEACGAGCDPGNWVAVRRLGSYLALVPDFRGLRADPDAYEAPWPPEVVKHRGAPLLAPDLVARLAERRECLYDASRYPELGAHELALTLQWTAPFDLLGRFPAAVRLARSGVVTTTHGGGDEALDALEGLLERAVGDAGPCRLEVWPDGEDVVFYVGADGIEEWRPLLWRDGEYAMRVAPGLVARFGVAVRASNDRSTAGPDPARPRS